MIFQFTFSHFMLLVGFWVLCLLMGKSEREQVMILYVFFQL